MKPDRMSTSISALVVAVLLIPLSSSYAVSLLSEITSEASKAAGFAFDIRHNRLPDGTVHFRIIVTEETAKFSSGATVALSTVEIADRSQSIRPVRQLSSTRDGHSVVCTFSVDQAALNQPNLCFVFTNYLERLVDGKLVHFPSAHFVYARLANLGRKR
jgi:hypothetical protein